MKLLETKKLKYFLTGLFALFACIFLNAQEMSSYIYISEDALIAGREHLFVKDILKEENTVLTTLANAELSPYIYISEDTPIAGAEHAFVKQDFPCDLQKNTDEKRIDKIKKNKQASNLPEKPIITEEPKAIIQALPIAPTPLSYLYCNEESAIITPQYRLNEHQLISKINRENIYADIENADSALYFPEQRQKFSVTATQCGVLTSFGPNSPSFS